MNFFCNNNSGTCTIGNAILMSIHRNTVPLFSIVNFQLKVSVEEAVNRLTKTIACSLY
jgi:hypothetical protein